jgi:hypothetical protein
LSAGVSSGMTITAVVAHRAAAVEMARAWLPDENVTTPRARSSGVSDDTAL